MSRRPTRALALALACAAGLLGAAAAPAAVEVEARLARSRITVGETTTLEVLVRGAGGGVRDPEFEIPPGLELLSSGRAQNFTWINGKSSVEVIYRYELAAQAAGRYALGPILVRVGQDAYRSGLLSLEATAAAARVGGRGNRSGSASLLVDVTPSDPWQGQACELRVRLIQRAALAEDPQYTPPPTPGFWTDKPSPPESYYADERGRPVLVTETRSRIYPLAPGIATVGQAVATLALAVGGGDPLAWLGGRLPRREEVVVSQPVAVRVRPLPPGAPEGFNGAVGALSVRWSADRARTSIDVPVTVRLDVRGVGNLPLIRPPVLADDDIEVFASTLEDSLPAGGGSGVGLRRFQWTVLARHTGTLLLAAPPFAWFDPASGSYRRARPDPIRLEVGPAQFAGSDAGAGLPAVFARHPIDPGAHPARPWAWSLAGLMLGVAVAVWRRSRLAGRAGAERARPLEWLRAVGRTSGPDFWRAADQASVWLGERGRPVEGLRREIAAARYAGGGAEAQAEGVRRRLVEEISSALPPAPATGALRVAAGVLVAAAVVWCALFGPRAGDPRHRAAVQAADQAARSGETTRARESWAVLWEAGVRHPALAARLAWVDAQAGSVGEAAAWVVRGELIATRDPSLRWVAERVREGGGLVGDAPARWPVTPLEWAIVGLLAGVAAGALWPRRGWVGAALGLSLLAGALDPLQTALADRTVRAVVREAVVLEGAGLELQPGQVVRLHERQGGRARVSAAGGVDGWVPGAAIDIASRAR